MRVLACAYVCVFTGNHECVCVQVKWSILMWGFKKRRWCRRQKEAKASTNGGKDYRREGDLGEGGVRG